MSTYSEVKILSVIFFHPGGGVGVSFICVEHLVSDFILHPWAGIFSARGQGVI